MSRLIPLAPILVMVSDDLPQSFWWNNRIYQVFEIVNHWRIDREWWRLRIARDYFLVHTTSGLLAVLFRDLLNNEWYLQRLYD